MKIYFYYALLLVLFWGCTAPQSAEQPVEASSIISNVNIINVRDGSIAEGKTVLIDTGRIVQILDSAPEEAGSALMIDGSGKFLLPGLAEMHAHIPSPEQGREYIEETLFLYLSNGVTTIRGMLGHPIHLELREEAEKGDLLSPRIFTSSPSLNGNSTQSPEEAREKILAYQADGYDFLKLHPGLRADVFEEIARTAREAGIPFAGHVSVSVGIRRALESGYASVDHVDGYLEGLVPESAGVAADENGFFGYNFTRLADTEKIAELVEMSRRHQVWVVPTQSLFERWFSPEDANALGRAPEMRYMPASTIEKWISSKQELTAGDFNESQWEEFNQIRRKLIYELQQNGHGLLLGSDAPQVFNVPGFSIHHELDAMIRAGLSPLEAIQSGTLNPALFFGREGDFGEITESASADFLLLNANPLEDIRALQMPAGVMVRGTWLSREEIDERLERIAAGAAQR